MSGRRWLRWLGAAALALLIGRVVFTLVVAGEFRDVATFGTEGCKQLPGVVGGEDIVVDAQAASAADSGPAGVFWVAADDRRAAQDTPNGRGRLYRIGADDPAARDVTPAEPVALHPHGLGLFRHAAAAGGASIGNVTATLAVVNHRGGGVFDTRDDAVELFDVVDDATLRHRASVQDPQLRPMNDVVPVDADRFYATIDHGHAEGALRSVEDFARMAWSGVVYWDGKAARRVADGLRYANGIAASADGATIWVAATTDTAVIGYDRDAATGDLRERVRIATGTGVDNIQLDEAGDLWLGAHPKLVTFLRHARDPAVRSPSQVLRIDGRSHAVQVVLADDGTQLSGSAAATPLTLRDGSRRLLVGPVFDPHLLDCRLPPRQP